VGGRHVTLGASVGLASARPAAADSGAPDTGLDAGDALLRDADTAMYAAKAAGKGRLRVFVPPGSA
jgi:GGDEF domain-containing protein